MSITLTHPTAGAGGTPLAIDLPTDLLWVDEFAWSAIEQSREYTSTGALHVEEWQRQAGRLITLEGGTDYAWCLRGPLLTLNAWAQQPGLLMTLTHKGTDYQVIWDHAARAIEAQAVVDYSDPEPNDAYSLTLRFLEMPE
jgi:hypothetical protein